MINMIGMALIIQKLVNDFNCSGPDCDNCIFDLDFESGGNMCLADLLEDRIDEIEKEFFKRCKK